MEAASTCGGPRASASRRDHGDAAQKKRPQELALASSWGLKSRLASARRAGLDDNGSHDGRGVACLIRSARFDAVATQRKIRAAGQAAGERPSTCLQRGASKERRALIRLPVPELPVAAPQRHKYLSRARCAPADAAQARHARAGRGDAQRGRRRVQRDADRSARNVVRKVRPIMAAGKSTAARPNVRPLKKRPSGRCRVRDV